MLAMNGAFNLGLDQTNWKAVEVIGSTDSTLNSSANAEDVCPAVVVRGQSREIETGPK